MQRMAIPCTLMDDEELIGKISERFGNSRWMFIPNTLHLEKIFVSEDLAKELQKHPRCRVSSTPTPYLFRMAGYPSFVKGPIPSLLPQLRHHPFPIRFRSEMTPRES